MTVTLSLRDRATAIRVVDCARGMLARGWCQNEWALDAEGRRVDNHGPAACRWCLEGALQTAFDLYHTPALVRTRVRHVIAQAIGLEPYLDTALKLVMWNDMVSRTQAQVLTAMDGALEALGAAA